MSHATQPCVLSPADVDLFVEAFLARWESPNTRAAYRQDLTAWLRWCHLHGKHPISDASRPLVEMWMRWLRDERGNSASTINHRVGTLTRFFELALDDDLVAKNPCRLVRRPKAGSDNNDRIALTRDEMQRLTAAAAASSAADHALVVLMGVCGLRVSEACSLDVTDCHEIAKAHRCVRFIGKGGKPALVPMPPAVQRAVDAAIGDRTSGPLLLRRDGTRMTRRSADRVVKRCAKTAGITAVAVSPHVLRHSFVVGALDAGAQPRTVQLSARHAQISTTLDVYDKGRQALDDHAAYVVAGYFGSAA
ncbi:integrase [Gordonia phage MichaelScott]|uniref:Integrase n=2 Tax=Beenievirus TaxID=3044673 RepID=A0A2K9VH72_9CAUD|nr:integrase [Gordonia phage Beenie]YP_010654588.1 integrase [Gordonia phage MichaelScott]AUV61595.1 tyrosine integrase [Gordonia phage Beenie]QOC56278.1 tyrosine integrase [Gordonia phage MichaelScott]